MSVAQQLLGSSASLLEGARTLLGLLNELGGDLLASEHLGVLVAVDSEAEKWLIGVDPDLLSADFRARRERELHEYGETSWPEVQRACHEVLRMLGESP